MAEPEEPPVSRRRQIDCDPLQAALLLPLVLLPLVLLPLVVVVLLLLLLPVWIPVEDSRRSADGTGWPGAGAGGLEPNAPSAQCATAAKDMRLSSLLSERNER